MNPYERWRQIIRPLIEQIHQQHRTYGYQSVTKRHRYRRPLQEHHIVANRIQTQWTATKPLEIVDSDMTMIRRMGKQVEWVFKLDTFNIEIIASALASRPGDPRPYFVLLDQLHRKRKGIHHHTVLHTDPMVAVFQLSLPTCSD
jgi:transposase InsO family protein